MTIARALAGASAVAAVLGAVACATGNANLGSGGEGTGGACPDELMLCAEGCVDTTLDPQNCGACGQACGNGEVCSQAKCGTECAGGSTKCNDGEQDRCVDLAADPSNCGDCGQACAAGEVCSQAQCAIECLGGSTKCNDGQNDLCVDTANDPKNCGACAKACAAGEVCTVGQCALQCSGGTTKCTVASKDVCVDTKVDPAHCGGCGKACPGGQVCVASTCTLSCPAPTVSCNGVCTNTSYDPKNCGQCGKSYTSTQACAGGVCVALGVLSSCQQILAGNPSATDGPYQINKGQGPIDVYCDMGGGGITYEAFAFGQHDKTYAGYGLLSVALLNTTVVQNAFIYLVNKQGGLINIDVGFQSNNCCIKAAEHLNKTEYLALGAGVYLYPAQPGTTSFDCNPSGGYVAPLWGWYRNSGEYATFPLPAGYFTTRTPGTTYQCSNASNPGWFVKSFK
jgi:hypothetical protein